MGYCTTKDTKTQHQKENITMQLRFLGRAYSTSRNQIEIAASKHTAPFLGQSYTPRRPVPKFNSH